MTLSVVIPAYNAASYICRTLDTVRAQTLSPHETIIVDDGSTDGTADTAAEYLARHQMNGTVLRNAHRGIAAARNSGMRAAAGTFIALLDSDDLWYPEKLAGVMEEFARYPEADVICHDENVTRGGRVLRVLRRTMPRGDLYESLLFEGNLLSPSATTIRRDKALADGGFDERSEYHTVEDYDFWMRLSQRCTVRFLGRVLGEYVLHDRSATRPIVSHHVALEGMLRNHLEAYLRSQPGPIARLRARRRLARVYRSAARQLIEHREAFSDQQTFVRRMLQTYPLEPRNVAVAILWVVGLLRRPAHAVQV